MGIMSRVLQYDSDLDEREEYAAELGTNNYDNSLHHTMSDARLNTPGRLSGCLYIDVDDARKHLTMKLISAVLNYKRIPDSVHNSEVLMLKDKNSGQKQRTSNNAQ